MKNTEDRQIRGASLERMGLIEAAQLEKGDEDKRQVWVACSSEAPYDRWFGPEVLVHEPGAVDLSFLGSSRAPVLLNHDHDEQIGVIDQITLGDDRKMRALLRFSRNAKASEVYDDIRDGIRHNISIGYRIRDYLPTKDADGEITEVRVTDWYPFEVSVVSVPADTDVGVGRSDQPKSIKKDAKMPKEDGIDLDAIRKDAMAEAEKKVREEMQSSRAAETEANKKAVADAAAKRAAEVTDIMELGAKFNMGKRAAEHVRAGGDLSDFRGLVLAEKGDDAPLSGHGDIGLNKREIENFSIMSLIRGTRRGASSDDRDAMQMEMEAVSAAADSLPKGTVARGWMLPPEVLRNFITEDMSRTLLAGTDTQLVPTEHRAQSYIDILRNSSSVMQAGARRLTGLSGNVDIPRMATSAGAAWISAEHGDSADGEPTFETVALTPKDISRSTPMSRRMQQQSSPAIEGLVRLDIAQSIALGIDLGALEGSGAAGQPTGVLNQSGIATPTAFAAVNPTFAEVVAMETAVANANALMGSLAYIGRTNMHGALKTTAVDAGSGQFVAQNGVVNGYRYIQSNQGTDGNLYFGNWADVLIGMWGGLDLVPDEATLAAKGGLYIRAFQTCDIAVRHPQSFAVNNDGV